VGVRWAFLMLSSFEGADVVALLCRCAARFVFISAPSAPSPDGAH
jgi:hypothetical protein